MFLWYTGPLEESDSLAAGQTLEEFLDGFEGVTREQALAVLDLAREDLLSDLENL